MSYAKPRREIVWTHDLDGVQTMAIQNPLDFYIEERFAQSEVLYFTIRADDPKAAYVAEDLELRWRDLRYFVYQLAKRRDSTGAGLIDVTAPATWNRLAYDKRVGSFKLDNVTTSAGLTAILDGSGWAGTVAADVDDVSTYSLEANDASVLDLVRKWAKITTTEVLFDTASNGVALAVQIGVDQGLGFRYGRNVAEIARTSNPPQFTRLYAFGRDDLTIAGLTGGLGYVEDFSFYTDQGMTLPDAQARYTREETWSDTTFTTEADLYAGALARLAIGAAPLINYTMAVLDLAELSSLPGDSFGLGDRVTAKDLDLGFEVVTRVVRLLRRPLEPARAEIELSYLPPVIPDPNVNNGRGDPTEEWVLFETRTETIRHFRNGLSIAGRLVLSCIDGAEWVTGFTLTGTGVGTGTITFTVLDDVTAEVLYPPTTLPVADGAPFVYNFTWAESDIASGEHTVTVRAQSSGAGIGVDTAVLGSSLWVLAKGTTQRTFTAPNSQRFDFTGTVQTFTVPDDVTELTIQCVAGSGGNSAIGGLVGGKGGGVTATRAVVAGTVLDVYVGGCGDALISNPPGWPNGGGGITTRVNGGGRSEVRPTGGAITTAYVIAGGGGGPGSQDVAGGNGGDGRFYTGQNSPVGAATGGTETAGGTGVGAGTLGDGAQGQGGNATTFAQDPAIGGSPTSAGGGGGDGWFGGGGQAYGFGAQGGAGGSGHIDGECFDLDIADGINTGAGYVIFSWETPA